MLNMQGNALIFDPTYFTQALQPDLNQFVASARRTLRDIDYDTMVGRGLSGALAVPTLARALHKDFFIVRVNPSAHDRSPGVGRLGKRWLFVDDFISSGITFNCTREGVEEALNMYARYRQQYQDVTFRQRYPEFTTTCAGAYLYSPDVFMAAYRLPGMNNL